MSRLETTAWELTDGDGDRVCRVQLLQVWAGEAEYSSTALLGPAEAAGGAGASEGEQLAVAYERDTKYTGATDKACSGICSGCTAASGSLRSGCDVLGSTVSETGGDCSGWLGGANMDAGLAP